MNRFREMRQKKHLTQAEMIQQYNERYRRNYSIPALSQMENGKRTPEMPALIDFAEFFGVSVDYLLGISDNPHNNKAPTKDNPIQVTIAFDTQRVVTEKEFSLLEAYRKASARDRNLVDMILEPESGSSD